MIVMYTIVTRYVFWVVILSTAPLGYGLEIQVCQNKHCCQNYAKANHHIVTSTPAGNDLVQTMRQLVPQATVKASGCLSQCDYGPNIQIATGKEESIHNQIFTPEAAAAALELSGVEVDMTLITAVKVMAQAEKETKRSEKERFLNSVIRALESKKEAGLTDIYNKCLAQALVMRAELAFYYHDKDYHKARQDVLKATELDPLHPRAWRILVDTSVGLDEKREALQGWAKNQPQFATKVAQELREL